MIWIRFSFTTDVFFGIFSESDNLPGILSSFNSSCRSLKPSDDIVYCLSSRCSSPGSFGGNMERPEKTGLNRLRRRSSILKTITLAAENVKDGNNTTTNFSRLKRRVSFAETFELKNYCLEETGLYEGAPERYQVKDAQQTSPIPPFEINEFGRRYSPETFHPDLNMSMYGEQLMEQGSIIENAILFQGPRNLHNRTTLEPVDMSMSRLDQSYFGQSMEMDTSSQTSVHVTRESVQITYSAMDMSEQQDNHGHPIGDFGFNQADPSLSAIFHALSPGGLLSRNHTLADVSVETFVMEEELMAQQEREEEQLRERTSLENVLDTVETNAEGNSPPEGQADMDISQMPASDPQDLIDLNSSRDRILSSEKVSQKTAVSQRPTSSPSIIPHVNLDDMDISQMVRSSPENLPKVRVAETERAAVEPIMTQEDGEDVDVFFSPEGTPQRSSQEGQADMDISHFAQNTPEVVLEVKPVVPEVKCVTEVTEQGEDRTSERQEGLSQEELPDMEISQMPKSSPESTSQRPQDDFADMDISQKPSTSQPEPSQESSEEDGISQALRKSLEQVSAEYLANMSLSQALKISPTRTTETPEESFSSNPEEITPQASPLSHPESDKRESATSLDGPLPDMDISHFLKVTPPKDGVEDRSLSEQREEVPENFAQSEERQEREEEQEAVDMEMSTQPPKGSLETMADMSISHITRVSPSRFSQDYNTRPTDLNSPDSPFREAPLDLSIARPPDDHEDNQENVAMDISQAVKASPAETIGNMSLLTQILTVSPRISHDGFSQESSPTQFFNQIPDDESPETSQTRNNHENTEENNDRENQKNNKFQENSGNKFQENPLDMTMSKNILRNEPSNISPQGWIDMSIVQPSSKTPQKHIAENNTQNTPEKKTNNNIPENRKTMEFQILEPSPIKLTPEDAADMSISDTSSESGKVAPSSVESDATFQTSFDFTSYQATKLLSPTLSSGNSADKTFASSPTNQQRTVTKVQFSHEGRMDSELRGISDEPALSRMWDTKNQSMFGNLSENSRVEWSVDELPVPNLNYTLKETSVDDEKIDVDREGDADATFGSENLSVTRFLGEEKEKMGMGKRKAVDGNDTFFVSPGAQGAHVELNQTVFSPVVLHDISAMDVSSTSSLPDSMNQDPVLQEILGKKLFTPPATNTFDNPFQQRLRFFQEQTGPNQTSSKATSSHFTDDSPRRRAQPFTPSRASSPLGDKTFMEAPHSVSVHDRVTELEKTLSSVDGTLSQDGSSSDDEDENFENEFVQTIHQQLVRLLAYGIVESQGIGRWTITIPGERTVLALLIKIPLTIRDIDQATAQIHCQAKMLSGNISQKKLDVEVEHVPRSPQYLLDVVCALRCLQRMEEATMVRPPLTMRPPPVLDW